MVNRCAVIDRRGAAAATAQNTTDLARFGLRQRVLGKSGDAAAQAQGGLRGRILRGELTVRGDLRYRCGAMVELHRKEFGLDGAYPLTAVKHPLGARAVHDRADLGGRGMNVYSELWALLRPEKSLDGGGALFGTLAGVSPLTVRVGGCEVSEGLFRPAGMSLRAEDVGRTLALLPCEEGFLLLFFVE